jgi:hypothetical protein
MVAEFGSVGWGFEQMATTEGNESGSFKRNQFAGFAAKTKRGN